MLGGERVWGLTQLTRRLDCKATAIMVVGQALLYVYILQYMYKSDCPKPHRIFS